MRRFIRFMSGPKNESDILTGSSTPNRFLFVSLAVIQAIYKHCISKCFFVKSQCQSPFPLSLESNLQTVNFLVFLLEEIGSDRAHCECMRRFASFVNCFLQNWSIDTFKHKTDKYKNWQFVDSSRLQFTSDESEFIPDYI
jgi:hypothetical protein